MTAFVSVALALTALAVLWLLYGSRSRPRSQAPSSNVALLHEQLRELERDLANGTLALEQYQSAREDLERRVLEEGDCDAAGVQPRVSNGSRLAWVLAVTVPLSALLLYLQLGTPHAISVAAQRDAAHEVSSEQIEAMIARLAARLEKTPNDGDGWTLLARSYLVSHRYGEAAAAYQRAAALITDDADLLADYADAVAARDGHDINGHALKIIEQALKIDPLHVKALALAGSAAFDRQDYRVAIAYWQKMRAHAEPGSELARGVESSIAEARQLGNLPSDTAQEQPAAAAVAAAAAAPQTGASVQGTVSLSTSLLANAHPSDTVFIYARAARGPRMPLAVVRRQVNDLPVTFTLDDSQAMAPMMKLSNFTEVVVGARISKSATATPQSGDLEGASATVSVGSTKVAVVIDSVVR